MLANYLNRFLHAATPCHDVLGNEKFLVRRDSEATPENKTT